MSDQDFQQQVLDRLEKLTIELEETNDRSERFDEKFAEYRQATQWVVQLAFSLIVSATLITIVSTVFKR